MKRIDALAAAVLFCGILPAAALGQQVDSSQAAAASREQRVITIKNGNLSGILHTIRELGGNVNVSAPDSEHIVISGAKERVDAYQEIVKELDIPAPAKSNVETTVYMIVASSQPVSAPVPAGLEPVVTQLRSIFSYKGFRVLDSFVLRSRSGDRGETSGFLPPLANTNVPASNKVIYQFRYNRVTVDSDKDHVIRFDRLAFGMKVPVNTDAKGQTQYVEAGISTDVDVPQGKKVVVGKTSAVEGSDSALILVISAKVVD